MIIGRRGRWWCSGGAGAGAGGGGGEAPCLVCLVCTLWDAAKVSETAEKMLGKTLVTKQTGADGKPNNTLLLAEKVHLDEHCGVPLFLKCSDGKAQVEIRRANFQGFLVNKCMSHIIVWRRERQQLSGISAFFCAGGSGPENNQERKGYINLRKIHGITAGCRWDIRQDKRGSTGRCPSDFLLFIESFT